MMQEYEMVRKTVAMDENLVNELDHFARSEDRDLSSASAMPCGSAFWRSKTRN